MEKNNPQNAFPKKTEIIFSDTKISFTYVDKDKFTLCTIPYVDVLKRTLTSKLNIFGRKYRLRDSTEYYIFTNHTRKDY